MTTNEDPSPDPAEVATEEPQEPDEQAEWRTLIAEESQEALRQLMERTSCKTFGELARRAARRMLEGLEPELLEWAEVPLDDLPTKTGWEVATFFRQRAQDARELNAAIPAVPVCPTEATWRHELQYLREWWQDATGTTLQGPVSEATRRRIQKTQLSSHAVAGLRRACEKYPHSLSTKELATAINRGVRIARDVRRELIGAGVAARPPGHKRTGLVASADGLLWDELHRSGKLKSAANRR